MRFGSAEIYDVIEHCFAPTTTHAAHTIVDSLVVGQSIAGGTDERVILFVKLLEGQMLTEDLEKRIKAEIRARRSARHVPARVSTIACLFRPSAALRSSKLALLSRSEGPVPRPRSFAFWHLRLPCNVVGSCRLTR